MAETVKSPCTQIKPSTPAKAVAPLVSTDLSFETAWSWWYDSYIGPGKTSKEYEEALSQVGSFQTIPEFWGLVNNLPPPSQLPFRASYHIMRKGIVPVWEDNENKYGGTLSVHIRKGDCDIAFLDTLLAAVGEQFTQFMNYGDDICGISISTRRKESVLNIWTKRADLMISPGFFLHNLAAVCPGFCFKDFVYKVHQFNNDFERESLNDSQFSVNLSETSVEFVPTGDFAPFDYPSTLDSEYSEFLQHGGVDHDFLNTSVEVTDVMVDLDLNGEEFPSFPVSPIRRQQATIY